MHQREYKYAKTIHLRNLQCQPGPATLANQTNSQVASTAREYSLDSGCDTLN